MAAEPENMRVLIVAPNISRRMGGEAVIPFHYVRELSALGVEAHALTHARVREELEAEPSLDPSRIHFVEDSSAERLIYRTGRLVPASLSDATFGMALGLLTMERLRSEAKSLVQRLDVQIVHQPTPVSPQMPSPLDDLGAPVVIGPMNGGMNYPPAFERDYGGGAPAVVAAGRRFARLGNKVFAGKRNAVRLLAANARTRNALHQATGATDVGILVENGVDLNLWTPAAKPPPTRLHFVFVGRLIKWKAVDILLEAFARVDGHARLSIVGDGPERAFLERLSVELGVADRVSFTGFLPQPQIRDALHDATALVLSSLYECGGAVVLEAFACARPAIATAWGGPEDYITPETGILVKPESRTAMVEGFAAAMSRMGANPSLAETMGYAARLRAEQNFSWSAKARKMLAIYSSLVSG
ncbi:MAG: glycosyltransferase [Alphaproteobacteria bacterium]|nr:glycosyltransferase [Alphaproteobacteria bacterium]